MRIYSLLIALASCLLGLSVLTSCASTTGNWDSTGYTVKSGDTLYSIAWRYEIDHEDLAEWNNLSSPYLIRPGDRLQTRPGSDGSSNDSKTRVYPASSRSSASRITVKKGDTLYSLAKKHYMPAWKLAMINELRQPYVLHPGQVLRLAGPTKSADPGPEASSRAPREPAGGNDVVWHWPVRGKIIKTFSRWKNDAKGIDISGKNGTVVKAAAAGKVVYSGNSLINYGHLVIIKHNRDYLSAYANNQKLLVKEGERVKAGQKIAELGDAAAKKPFLHFEIRKKGKPVDPLRHLPDS